MRRLSLSVCRPAHLSAHPHTHPGPSFLPFCPNAHPPSRKLFYNAYIMPHFDYCCVIRGNCSAYLEDKLTKFQKRATRLILDRDVSTPSVFLFSELKRMPFPDRLIYKKSLHMYKTIHGGAPKYLRTPFTFTFEIHSRILRSTCPLQLYSSKPRSELYKRSFKYSGVSIWNNVPVHVQHSPSVNVFKARYLKWVQHQGIPE